MIEVAADIPSPTSYQLMAAILKNTELKSSTLVEYVVPSEATDLNANSPQHNHYAVVDNNSEDQNVLFVFMPGARGLPLSNRLIVQQAASQGYHAIALAYPNETPVTDPSICGNSPDGNCYHQVRREILKGSNRSNKVEVTPGNSIENRLVKLLQYLDLQYPNQGWSNYLEDNSPRWSRIIISGHSMGGSQAAFIAKIYEVFKVVLFANEVENNLVYQYYAPWLSVDSATHPEKYVGFMHREDRFNARLYNWDLMALDDAQPLVVNVDYQTPPYNGSARLFTEATPEIADKFHEAVVVDIFTPKNSDGSPVYAEVWEYLLEAR